MKCAKGETRGEGPGALAASVQRRKGLPPPAALTQYARLPAVSAALRMMVSWPRPEASPGISSEKPIFPC